MINANVSFLSRMESDLYRNTGREALISLMPFVARSVAYLGPGGRGGLSHCKIHTFTSLIDEICFSQQKLIRKRESLQYKIGSLYSKLSEKFVSRIQKYFLE